MSFEPRKSSAGCSPVKSTQTPRVQSACIISTTVAASRKIRMRSIYLLALAAAILSLCVRVPATQAALAATGIFEVRTGGNDNNAGYFNPSGGSPGTDWSQQDAPQITIDGATISAAVHTTTTQINLTGTTVSAAWNRNGLRITGGTATAGLYEITAVDVPNNRVTLDRSAGTAAQTATGRVGGCFATPGNLSTGSGFFTVAGMTAHIKAGTYTITTSTPGPAGPLSMGNAQRLRIIGYDATRGDSPGIGARPVISAGSVGSVTIIDMNSSGGGTRVLRNVSVTGNSQSSTIGIAAATNFLFDCDVTACTTGITSPAGSRLYATNCTTGISMGATTITAAVVRSCTTGILGSTGEARHCIVIGGTTAYHWTNNPAQLFNCIAYNATTGLLVDSGRIVYVSNFVISTCTNSITETAAGLVYVDKVFYYNSGAPTTGNTIALSATTSLSADPFTNAAGDDFSPNNTTNGGASVRAAGVPGAFPGLSTTGYMDAGAVQHQDSGGGSPLRIGAPRISPSR